MKTIRDNQKEVLLKRMESYKRNCGRAGRHYSEYLGVSYSNYHQKYCVQVGNKSSTKYFDTAKEAALYYDNRVLSLYEDAITNKELGLLP